MPQDAFAELLTQRGSRRYYGPEISLIESGKKVLSLADVEAIASVDPQRRGKLWLGWGEAEDATMGEPREPDTINIGGLEIDRASIVRFSDEELAEAVRQIAEEEAREQERAAPAPAPRKAAGKKRHPR